MKNQIELSSHERKILLSLKLPGTLAEISRRLNIPRSTIEYNIQKLLNDKMITFSLKKKRKIYNLVINNSDQKQILPPQSPVVNIGPITIYSGVRAIETLWQEVIKEPARSRMFGIQPRRSFEEAVKKSSIKIVEGVSKSITEKNFIIDSIVHGGLTDILFNRYENNTAKNIATSFTKRPEDIVRVEKDFLDEKSEMFIIGNFSFFIDWYQEVAIKIENKNINHLLLSLYQASKAYGTRYNQGRDVEGFISEI